MRTRQCWHTLSGLMAATILLPIAQTTAQEAKIQAAFAKVEGYLSTHCYRCHGAQKDKGGLRIDNLSRDAKELPETWQEVVDRMNLGDMPPPKEPRPPAKETQAVIDTIQQILRWTSETDGSRISMIRRLSREEYRLTIGDLLGIDLDVDALPPDGSNEAFDTLADDLYMTGMHLEQYLAMGRRAVRQVLAQPAERPPLHRLRIDLQEIKGRKHQQGRFFSYSLGKAPAFQHGGSSGVGGVDGDWFYGHALQFNPSIRKGLITLTKDLRIPFTGTYRIRLRVAGHRVKLFKGNLITGRPILIGSKRVGTSRQQARTLEFTLDAKQGQKLHLHLGGERIWFDYMEIDGPHFDFASWPAPLTRQLLPPRNADGSDTDYVRAVITDFLPRAWRRVVTQAEIEAMVKRYTTMRSAHTHEAALESTLVTVLTAPQFLYIIGPKSASNDDQARLDPYQMANRLSYFLWSSMPDQHLFDAARTGGLSTAEDLLKQVDRMLADPRAHDLALRFGRQWLSLHRLASIDPDPKRFRGWSETLRASMRQETSLFLQKVIRENRSIIEFIDSDWMLVDEHLAGLYAVPERIGDGFRMVPAVHGRGGLLTQGSILTLTSGNTRTSPVKRGVYVLERILGTPPPPPPPNAGELDEDEIDLGKRSLREQLEAHRHNPACAACHDRIDPLGFALEGYDVIGRRQVPGAKRQSADTSFTLPDGYSGKGAEELKAILLSSRRDLFVTNMVRRLFSYALGRHITAADEPVIKNMASALAADDHRFHALVKLIVTSDLFALK